MKKVIIVTGGSCGIGNTIVTELAKTHLFQVVLNYNMSRNEAEQTQKMLKKDGIDIDIFKADVTNEEEVKSMVNFTINKYGKIDCLVNNAGIAKIQLFTDTTIQDWNNVINTNLTSMFLVSKEVVPHMIHEKSGCIVNVSSIWGLVGASCEVAYSASKARSHWLY